MGSNSYFSRIIADDFLPSHSVNTHLNAPDHQTAKTSAFIEVLTLTDKQLIKSIWLVWLIITLLIPVEAIIFDF